MELKRNLELKKLLEFCLGNGGQVFKFFLLCSHEGCKNDRAESHNDSMLRAKISE